MRQQRTVQIGLQNSKTFGKISQFLKQNVPLPYDNFTKYLYNSKEIVKYVTLIRFPLLGKSGKYNTDSNQSNRALSVSSSVVRFRFHCYLRCYCKTVKKRSITFRLFLSLYSTKWSPSKLCITKYCVTHCSASCRPWVEILMIFAARTKSTCSHW